MIPAFAEDYGAYALGLLALIAADPEACQVVSTFEIPEGSEPSWAHPVIAGTRLYLREQDNLFCYDLTGGE